MTDPLLRKLHAPTQLYFFYADTGGIHSLPQLGGIAQDTANHIDAIGRDRIRPHAHRRPPKKYRDDLSDTPHSNVPDLHLRRCYFTIVFHSSEFEIEFLAPRIDGSLDWQGSIELIRCLIRFYFRFKRHPRYGQSNFAQRRFRHATL